MHCELCQEEVGDRVGRESSAGRLRFIQQQSLPELATTPVRQTALFSRDESL
jgi:hypothetical protein